MKKHSRDANCALHGCSKAEPKNFAPPQTPFPEVRPSGTAKI